MIPMRLRLAVLWFSLLSSWALPVHAFHTWKKETLPNGMTLLVVEKADVPAVSLTLLVKHGTTSEPVDKNGVATLTARLLKEGTRRWSSEQIAERIATVGGEFVEDIHFDYTTFDWAVLKEDVAPALELLADVVQHPLFSSGAVERARTAAIATRQAETEETPEALLLRYLFATGPYGRSPLGEVAALERITRADVVRFHQQMYHPREVILAAAGDVSLEKLKALATQYFADWSPPEKAGAALSAVSVRKEAAVLVLDRPLVQSEVRLVFVGAPAASPDAPALLLLSYLLGGSADSRLGQNLRERKRWVYSAQCVAEPFRQTGLFYIDLSVPYEVIVPALQEAVHEIVRLRTELVSVAELTRAKQNLSARLTFAVEQVRDIARLVAEHEAYTHGQERPDHIVQALGSVSADDIQRVARQYLDPRKAVVSVVGDRQALEKFAPALAAGKLPQWSPPGDGTQSTWATPGAISGANEGRIP
ncbi:MAG: insulinase family protein [Deltaproteobacteria bacterium]|nr:insulinase family protein [Deltaproteobacteria bacterium]